MKILPYSVPQSIQEGIKKQLEFQQEASIIERSLFH